MKSETVASSQVHAGMGNIDPAEVAYYERLSHAWWERDGQLWPLHGLNRLRINDICDTVVRSWPQCADGVKPLEGLSVLDVGCGGGLLSESLALSGASVHGIDVVKRNLAVARAHCVRHSLDIRYEETTVEALAEGGDRYDIVFSMEVIEHVPDWRQFVAACMTLVRPGGLIFLATIDRTIKSFMFAIVGAEYVWRLLPRGTHQWSRFVRPAELAGLLADASFEIVRETGVKLNPFTRRFSTTRNMSVNYMLAARRRADDAKRERLNRASAESVLRQSEHAAVNRSYTRRSTQTGACE